MDFRPELSWEFLSTDEITAKSIRAVRNHVRHAKESSPWYKEKLFDINPEDIQTIEAIQALPITTKTEVIADSHQFYGVDAEHIAETVITSGSSGKPLIVPLTANDLDRLAFNEALSFFSAGITPHDRAQILVSLDRLFIAGMAYYRGLTLMRVNTTRIGVLPLDMQKYYIELLKPTVLVGVPSFLKKLGHDMQKNGFDAALSTVKKIICIGESLRDETMQLNSVGTALESLFNAKVYSTYATTELAVAYCECEAQAGGHAHPELVYTEILDDAGNQVPDGAIGELVATPLGVEGMPLIRYRTGDLTFKIATGKPCACGRNSLRIGPIVGRKSQVIKCKGTTVYPLALTSALDEMETIDDYVIVLEGDDSLSDAVTIYAATAPANIVAIVQHLRARARVLFPVLVSNVRTIESLRGQSRKKIRIIDKRMRRK